MTKDNFRFPHGELHNACYKAALLNGLLFVIGLLCVHPLFGQQTAHTSPAGTKFLLYNPPSYNGSSGAPLLVSLHGLSEVGSDLNMLTAPYAPKNPAWLISRNMWPSSRPFIVLSPQLKRNEAIFIRDENWIPSYVDEVIEYVKTIRNIDANRIYLTGLSLGGHGCLFYAAAYPEKVAAMVPIAGRADTVMSHACKFANIPTWIFHGTEDSQIDPQQPLDLRDAAHECAGRKYNLHVTMLAAKRHELWNELYDHSAGYPIFDWMLKFSKNDHSNKTPYVNAGADKKILDRDASLHLYGDFFDWEGTISSVAWTKVSGPEVQMENANSRHLRLRNFVPGTYVFQLQVTDDDGAHGSDQVTLEIVGSLPPSTPAVTDLILMNGASNQDIGSLNEGYGIYRNTLNVTEFNVRAIANGNTSSVRFSVDANQNVVTGSSYFPHLVINQTSLPEWRMANGTYTICATAYSGSNAGGTRGVTQCFTVTVADNPTDPPAEEPPPGEDPDPPSEEPTDPPSEEPDPPSEEPTDPPAEEPPPGEDPDPPSEEPTNPPSEEPGNPPSEEPTDPPSQEPTNPPSEPPPGNDPGVVTHVPDQGEYESLKIFPVPASGRINIEGLLSGPEPVHYTIVGPTGVEYQRGVLNPNRREATIDFSLRKGLYILLLTSQKAQYRVKFLVE